MENLDELKVLLTKTYEIYKNICKDWRLERGLLFNQMATTVSQTIEDGNKLLDIFKYRDFLNEKKLEQVLMISSLPNVSHTRVKQLNSTLFKLVTYNTKKVNGKAGTISINKCLNDMFGLRVITERIFTFNEVNNFIKQNFPKFKCLDSSKGDYRAIHIYIKEDNFNYLWEVQLWFKDDEKQNHESHKKHKQEYTKWEQLFKNTQGGLKW